MRTRRHQKENSVNYSSSGSPIKRIFISEVIWWVFLSICRMLLRSLRRSRTTASYESSSKRQKMTATIFSEICCNYVQKSLHNSKFIRRKLQGRKFEKTQKKRSTTQYSLKLLTQYRHYNTIFRARCLCLHYLQKGLHDLLWRRLPSYRYSATLW